MSKYLKVSSDEDIQLEEFADEAAIVADTDLMEAIDCGEAALIKFVEGKYFTLLVNCIEASEVEDGEDQVEEDEWEIKWKEII